jgi:hypothetical protein
MLISVVVGRPTFAPYKNNKKQHMNFKTIFPTLAFTAASLIASASSTETSVAVVANENAKTFKLIYKSASASKVQITIVNSDKQVVFSESFNNMNGFARPYNFEGLPEGDYTIEVKDSQGTKVEKVSYHTAAKEKSLIKITKLSEQSKYMLTVAGKGMNIVNVNILDADGNSVFQNAHIVEGNFGVVYNLVKAGSYTFVVTDKAGETHLFMN